MPLLVRLAVARRPPPSPTATLLTTTYAILAPSPA
eukprot:CAMPEP_0184544248 /NCGR_PEP_ID=MMETSP0199_2-20130426/3491_1 /TAXON_ID=1112570 /ORGANISM="Thraustochytrium sp., Strain LLF1b" /LENGTH=34 /DNA_ID= /DNA_START= /DNA_END= /DNA_ORIENTATION=